MSRTVMKNLDLFSGRKGLFLVLSAIILCLGLSFSYPLGILPLEGVFLSLVLPLVFLLFLVRQETMLLAIVAAYFGAGYLFPELLIQGLIRSVLLLLMGLMLILRSGAKQIINRVSTPLDKMIFLWLTVVVISFFYGLYRGNETGYLAGDLFKFVEIISVFWLTTFIVRTRRQVRFLIWGFLFVVLVFGAIDLTTFLSRASFVGEALGARVRAGVQFSSIFALLLVMSLMLYERKLRTRLVLTFLGILFFFGFAVSFLRTGYIALPVAAVVVFLLHLHKNKVRSFTGTINLVPLVVLLVMSLILGGMIITAINPDIDLIKATFTRLGTFTDSAISSPLGVRMLEIRSIFSDVLTRSPLIGNGLGGEYYSPSEVLGEGLRWGMKHYVHNNYFDFLVRTGILGLLVFVLIAFKYLRDVIRFYLKSEDRFYQEVLLGSIGIFIAVCIIALSSGIFYSPFVFMVMAMSYCVAHLEQHRSLGANEK